MSGESITKHQADILEQSAESIEKKTKVGSAVPGKDATAYYKAKYIADEDVPIEEKNYYLDKLGLKSRTQIALPFTDHDLKVIHDKEKMLELQHFDTWIQKTYNMYGDPNTLKLINEIYPEYAQAREEELNSILDIKKRMHILAIHGPRDKKDLFLLYKYGTDAEFREAVGADIGPAVSTAYAPGLFNNRRKERRAAALDLSGTGLLTYNAKPPRTMAGLPTLAKYAP